MAAAKEAGAGKRDYVRRAYVQKAYVVARVCRRVEGGENLSEICRDPTMPGRSTVMSWAAQHEELRARMEAAHALCPETRRVYVRWSDEVAAEFLGRIEDGAGCARCARRGTCRRTAR